MNCLCRQDTLNGKTEKAKMTEAEPAISEYINLGEGIPYAEYQRHINSYIFASKFVQNKVVLDIACGSGTGTTYLAGKGAKTVVGADISQEALRDAKRWDKGRKRVEFILSDAEILPFVDNSFDVIVSLETIEHLKEPERFLAECRRALGKKGIFVCSTPNKKVYSPLFRKPVNPYHVREFPPEEFYDLLSKYFVNVEPYGQQQLNLGNKMKLQLTFTLAHILFTLFGRDRMRSFLYRLYRRVSREPCVSGFREDIDETADRNYEVVSVGNSSYKTPMVMVAVAEVED